MKYIEMDGEYRRSVGADPDTKKIARQAEAGTLPERHVEASKAQDKTGVDASISVASPWCL